MNKRFLILLLALLLSTAFFAEPPAWYNLSSRKISYPEILYFTGIAFGERAANESVDKALSRLKDAARVDMLSQVEVSVNNVSKLNTSANTTARNEAIIMEMQENFYSTTMTQLAFDNIHGVISETWQDPHSNQIAAFAYVNKQEAAQFYLNRIKVTYEKVKSTKVIVDYLISNSETIKALQEVKKAQADFELSDGDYRWLLVLGYDENILHDIAKQRNELAEWINKRLSDLSNTTTVCFQCSGQIFERSCSWFADKIKGKMNEVACSFVDLPISADWIIDMKVIAEPDEARNNSDMEFVTITVSGSASNTRNQRNYNFYESERDGASKVNGGHKLAVRKILDRGVFTETIANDIINILKSN